MNLPFMKFYPRDWMGEQGLQRLGYAERGLWIELLCLMATGDEYGRLTNGGKPLTPAEIARLTRGDKQEVEQLLEHLLEQKVCGRDEDGIIYSRRMVKDAHIREVRADAGKLRWHPTQTAEESRSQIPDPRSHSLLTDLLEQMLEQMPEQAARWRPYVRRVLEARPEFIKLKPDDLVRVFQSAEAQGVNWKPLFDEWVADVANTLGDIQSPLAYMRNRLLKRNQRPSSGPRQSFKTPATPPALIDQVCRGEPQPIKNAVLLLHAATTPSATRNAWKTIDNTLFTQADKDCAARYVETYKRAVQSQA